nr:putative reverse transcriptase domain-containing protein [Tanacetum cinerariifolium]
MLKVSPWKRVIRFGKWGKMNPRYIRPFKILAKVGMVAYRLELSEQLSRVHSTFHVSNLKKSLSEKTFVIPLEEIQIDDKLNFVKEPVEIMDREIDDDKDTAKQKQLVKIIPHEEGVAIDAIPLAVKPPSIVNWKIQKDGNKSYYKIIRAYGSSKIYLIFSHMLKDFDREDVETLWKLVKA